MMLASKARLEAMCAVLPAEEAHELQMIFDKQPDDEEVQENVLWRYICERYPVSLHCNDPEMLEVVAAYSGMTPKSVKEMLQQVIGNVRRG